MESVLSIESPKSGGNSSHQRRSSGTFLHDSYSSSMDFPAYIPWQTLSTDLSDKLRHGSVRINRSNCLEWATIKEENERTPLLEQIARKFSSQSRAGSSSSCSEASKPGVTDAVRGGANWTVAAFLLINSALGAGVLNYPAAYDRVGGIVMATIIQLILMALLAGTMIILVYCSDLNRDNTYHDVLQSMCGKRAQQISAVSIMFTCYGICVTFLIIIGDQYDRIFSSLIGNQFCHTWYFDRRFTICATAIICILPMCYYKRLDFLRYASTLGIFAMLYVVFLNVYQYYVLDPPQGIVIKTSPDSVVNMFAVIPVMCFAYQTHEIVVPIYACMAERKLSSFTKATALALGVLFILYCVSGSFGYLTFGSTVAPDIMQQYNAKDPIVIVGIVALVIKMITTYPPLMFCGRGALDGLYAEFAKLSAEQYISGEYRRRVFVTTIWFFTTLIVGLFTPNITIAIELLGSLASANVFIFPGLCLIAVVRRLDPECSSWWSIALYLFSILVILTGVLVCGIVLMQVIHDLQGGDEEIQQLLCR